MSDRQSVVIFRDHLGRYSETFITAQAGALSRYTPVFAGSRIVSRRGMDGAELVVANSGGPLGKPREYLFKRWGVAPGLLRRLTEVRPALIHAHFGPDGATALFLARRLRVPLIVTFHGYDISESDEVAGRSFSAHRLYLGRRGALQREGSRFIAA